jgi:hypothetical protein
MTKGIPHLVEMHDKHGKDGLVVFTVTLDSPTDVKARQKVEAYLAKRKLPFRTMNLDQQDPKKPPLTLDFGGGVPGVFVFNRDNRHVLKLPQLATPTNSEEKAYDLDVLHAAIEAEMKKK